MVAVVVGSIIEKKKTRGFRRGAIGNGGGSHVGKRRVRICGRVW